MNYIPSTKKEIIDLAFQIAQQEGKTIYNPQYLNRYLQKAIEFIIDSHGNLDQMAFAQLADNFKAYFTLRDKVEFISKLIAPAKALDKFSNIVPVFLNYYSIPNYFRKYLAKKWKVDSRWVRNTLIGWRRKMDSLLPDQFQIEPLTDMFLELAIHYKQSARNIDDDDIKVIGILQKKHVLHLLPSQMLDLTPLLPSELVKNYDYLKNNATELPNELKLKLEIHTHQISKKSFLNSLNELLNDVKENKAQYPSDDQRYKNCAGYINKINLILQKVDSPEFNTIFENFIIGNRFTNSVSKLFRTPEIKKFYTVFRGIFSLTLANMYPSAIVRFMSIFNPDNCLTRPFSSANRKRKHLPANLLSNKYIVERKDSPDSNYHLPNRYNPRKPNKKINTEEVNATEIFKRGKPIWLGMPIYSLDQMTNGLIKGKRKGIFWFQLIPSKKIVECVNRGAEVRQILLNIPQGATYKIVVNIALASDNRSAFAHRSRFLEDWDYKHSDLQIPSHDFLGVDFNRIGKFMVAVANLDKEINILPMMKQYQKAYDKLEWYRKCEIPNIQKKLDANTEKSGRPLTTERSVRLRAQITLLYRRRARITKEVKRQALMIYLFIAYKSGAKYLSWDSVGGISTRNKRGALANAITYLPKNKELFELIGEWAQDLIEQGHLPFLNDIVPVSPYTSQVCGHCFNTTGKMNKTLSKGIPYNDFLCTACGKSSNRHSNAAQVSAILLQNHIQNAQINDSYFTPSPLTMG